MAVPSFSLLFRLDKDANHLLPADLLGRRLLAHGANATAAPELTPTQDFHQENQHTVWKGIWTGTDYMGGGTRRVGSHGTNGYNPEKDVLQQLEGIRLYVRCGAPILRQWITGQRGVRIERPAQRVVERVHMLPRSKNGDL